MRQARPAHSLDVATHDLARRHPLSFYAALIMACACQAGCRVLASEDRQHSQRFEGTLTVRNPFRG